MSDSLVPSFTTVLLVLRRGRCFSRNGHENLEEVPREILGDEPYIFDVYVFPVVLIVVFVDFQVFGLAQRRTWTSTKNQLLPVYPIFLAF